MFFYTIGKNWWLVVMLSLSIGWAQAGNTLLAPGHIEIVYTIDGKSYSHTFTGDKFENSKVKVTLSDFAWGRFTRQQVFVVPKQNIELEAVNWVVKLQDLKGVKFFGNGIQSWTNSQEYDMDDKMRGVGGILKGAAGYYGDYFFADYKKKKKGYLHSWTYTYLRHQDQEIEFIGSMNESTGYTGFQLDAAEQTLSIQKECAGVKPAKSGYLALDLFFAKGDDPIVFQEYNKAYQVGGTTQAKPALGWTSWYHYYTDISEEVILENLNAFKEKNIPIDLFQIDDGFQRSVGEWTTPNEKFPKGMKHIADEIHGAGYKAGLWLAPFICEKKSAITKEHPDWLLQNDKGKPIKAGLNPGWSGVYYALDIYNPEVRAHVANTLDTVFNVWGYDMIKVDFLFAAAIQPPEGKTKGQVMTDAMQILRELAADKLVLGCGVPLGPSFNQVDYCRIGSDIHMKWEHKLLKVLGMRERLSVWNSLTSTIGRHQLSGNFFLNDPDAFVLRDEKNKLDEHAKFTSFLTNNIFGELVLTSDNISKYDSATLQTYLSGFPFTKKEDISVIKQGDAYEVTFSIDDRKYLAFINLGKKAHTFTVPEGHHYFNNQRISITQPNARLTMEPHQSTILYQIKGRPYEMLGGKGYLFAGAAMQHYQASNSGKMSFSWLPQAQKDLPIFITVPDDLKEATVNGKLLKVQKVGGVNVVAYVP